jgi:hypothetical protein
MLDTAGTAITFGAVWCVWYAKRVWYEQHASSPRIIRGEVIQLGQSRVILSGGVRHEQ